VDESEDSLADAVGPWVLPTELITVVEIVRKDRIKVCRIDINGIIYAT
jgi:hypothetical protein